MATLTSKIKMCNKFRCGRWTRTTDLQDMSLTSYQLLLFRCKKHHLSSQISGVKKINNNLLNSKTNKRVGDTIGVTPIPVRR